jgi:excisionase family DNA binding protein
LRPEFTVPACWRVTRVAAYLDVSKKRVYQMIDEGKLEAVSVGPRGTRVLRASIDRFLEGKKADA